MSVERPASKVEREELIAIYELGGELAKLLQRKRTANVRAALEANVEKASALGVRFDPKFLEEIMANKL